MTTTDSPKPTGDRPFTERAIKLYELRLQLAELEWQEQQAVLLQSHDRADKVVSILRKLRRDGLLAVGSVAWDGISEMITAAVDDDYYHYPTEGAEELFGEALAELEEQFSLGDFWRSRAEWCRRLIGQTAARKLKESLADVIPEQEFLLFELGRLVGEILWPADVYLHPYEEYPMPNAAASASVDGSDGAKNEIGDAPNKPRPARFGGGGASYSFAFIANVDRRPGELPVPDALLDDVRHVWIQAGMPVDSGFPKPAPTLAPRLEIDRMRGAA